MRSRYVTHTTFIIVLIYTLLLFLNLTGLVVADAFDKDNLLGTFLLVVPNIDVLTHIF